MYIFIVPALHQDPDIEVLDNLNGAEFALIEHSKVYSGKWKTEQLNNNDFNETGEIKYYIENWLFHTHPKTKVSRWINRQELSIGTQRRAFQVMESDMNKGIFTFKQDTQAFLRPNFIIAIVVLRKETANLNLIYTSSFLSFIPKVNGSGIGAIRKFCDMWSDKTSEKIDGTKLKKCPCTLQSAKMDPDLSQDFTCSVTQPDCHENVNAHRCYVLKLNNT